MPTLKTNYQYENSSWMLAECHIEHYHHVANYWNLLPVMHKKT